MRKLPFLTNERLSRLVVSLMLCLGLLLPLMMTFGAGSAAVQASLTAALLCALFMVLGSLKRGRLILMILLGATAAVQLALPGFGLFGTAFESLKAVALYFNDVPSAAPLFAGDIAITLGVGLAVVCYAFTSRSVGFLPATVLVVLMLFGMWSLGQAEYLWYAAPALAALLLLVSQTSHDKINLFEVLPMAAAVVALALLILPAGRVTVGPLHTAAMNLKQTISDYLFFTEPRNVFTLGNYGYYPMGNGRLGGEATPSNVPVMMVKTDRRTLLRGVVKDEYTGRSWRDTSSGKRYLYVNPRYRALRDSVFLESLPPQAVRSASTMLDQHAVTVQMQNTAASTVFSPVFLRRFSAQSDMVGYFNESSELFITRDLKRDDRYTVYAPLLEGGDSALGSLIAAAPKGADKYYQQALEDYLDLPDHMEAKVFEDLRNIVASAQTPYDRACAIMRHLQRYYRYTLEPRTPPENQDFVTYFLYVGKKGYCTYYASAMTVLCRMAGLPARYVEGFVAQPAADGFAYVTGEDAHAWTEVYFEGFGWVPFDATPHQQEQDDPPPEDEPEPTPTPTPTPPPEDEDEPTPTPPPDDPDNTPEPDPKDDPDKPDVPWLWLILLAMLIAACVRIALCMPDRVAMRKKSDVDRIFVYGNAAYAVMKLRKRTPRPGETPMLFARRMDRQKAFPAPISPLWRMMALSNYSRSEPGSEQVSRARDVFKKLYSRQKLWTRLRFMLWAGFGRGLYTCLDTKVDHQPIEQQYSYAAQVAKHKPGKKKLFRLSKKK
ncbi:MAG: transglutaminase domain-containing protein [Clostridia bacterium]|nr:transglutaminase domain-containing protein [Clostridia bacterium]